MWDFDQNMSQRFYFSDISHMFLNQNQLPIRLPSFHLNFTKVKLRTHGLISINGEVNS